MQISSDKSLSLLNQRATQSNNSSSVNQVKSAQVQKIESGTPNNAVISDVVRQERFDVDEETLAFIEQEFEARSESSLGGELVRSDEQATRQSNPFQKEVNNNFEPLNSANQNAVSVYQSINTLANSENIQELFGVDLFA